MCLNAGHRGVGAAYLDHAFDLMKALRALLVFLFGQVPPAVLVHKGIVVLIACSDAVHLLMAGLLHPSLQPCLEFAGCCASCICYGMQTRGHTEGCSIATLNAT